MPTSWTTESIDSTTHTKEEVSDIIYCNNTTIYCNSTAYYCNGTPVYSRGTESVDTTTWSDE